MTDGPSDKSRGIALALCIPLGVFGAHRFYAGRIGSGLAMLGTMGGFGLWWLYDLILIAGGSFSDADGRMIRRWDTPEVAEAARRDAVPEEVWDELDQLRAEVRELAERLDFAERLLARQGEARGLPPDTRA
ncbi:MAG: TM2 domain-containing protein [Gemmatimonadales bacterium]|nr:TM2 domain-containing protein [Gemmatimonadales bacterium]